MPSSKPSTVTQLVRLTMSNVKNPWAKKTTGAITIQLSRDATFPAGDTSQKYIIAETTTLTLDTSKFSVNTISSLSATTTEKVIQEAIGTMGLSFTLASQVPGTAENSNYEQALHIFFPPTIDSSGGVASISATSMKLSSTSASSITVEADSSGTHDENCQVDGYVCYIIRFPQSTIVDRGAHSISIAGSLKNPISVATAGNFVMRTMIRTNTGGTTSDWAYIDMATIASNYKAIAGTIAKDKLAVDWQATGATDETYKGN